MTEPTDLTRDMLARFIPDPRTIRAFEDLKSNSDGLVTTVAALQDVPLIGLTFSAIMNNDRQIAAGSNITFTDGGPKGQITFNLTDTGVSAATYGSATQIPQIAVDAKGRISLAANAPLISDNVSEGSVNLFFTNARARAALSGIGGIDYNSTTGAISIAANGVTNSLFRQSAALSVVGRSANSTGDVADMAAASDHQILRRSGTSLGFGAVNLAQSAAVTGTLAAGNGGTGIASYTIGDMLYASGAATLTALADVATGNALISGGVGTAPSWGKIGLTTHITGTLAVGNGGTGAATITASYLVKANGSSAFSASPVYIDGSDRVLIGTTSVAASNWDREFKSTAAGGWPLALNANDRGLIVRNSSATSGYYAYFEYNGGTNNGSISWSGATTSFNTSSDRRLKMNICDARETGDIIDGIRVRQFDWKADGIHCRYGMIAQELLKIVPEAVHVPAIKKGMMAIDYSKLVPLLVKEVQSLRRRVSDLETKSLT